MQKYHLREALLLQRNRTPRRAQLKTSSMDQFTLYMFKEYLKAQPQNPKAREMVHAFDAGTLALKSSEDFALRLGLESALGLVPITQDLALRVLRSPTNTPFLLADSPAIFSNHYRRDVKGMGVAGVATRGFMMTMPIDSKTVVLLFDSAVYHAPPSPVIDVSEDDVENLNTLQVYEAKDCVYCSEARDLEYVRRLVSEHPMPLGDGIGGFGVLKPADPVLDSRGDEIMHIYEPPPPITLDLSFLRTDPCPLDENLMAIRCQDLRDRYGDAARLAVGRSLLGIDEFMEWAAPRVVRLDPGSEGT